MTIPNTILYNPAPQFTDDNANPLDSGRLQIFEAGTGILKTIYADSTQATPITNPVVLGSGGFTNGGVWIPEGNYDLSIERYDGTLLGVPQYTRIRFRENIAGAGDVGSGGGAGMYTVESIEDLRDVPADTASLLYVAGYYGIGTSGGGFFYWDTSASTVDDGGSVFAPNGAPATGRWVRMFFGTDLTMEDWGARQGSSYSVASNVENMITFAQANQEYRCVLNTGTWYLNGNVDFSGDISVLVKPDALFTGLTGIHILTFSCTNLAIESRTTIANKIPSSLLTLEITSKIQCLPQWWGATEGTGTDSTTSFDTCVFRSGTNDILIDSAFAINGVDFTGHKLVKGGDGYLSMGLSGGTFDQVEADGFFLGGTWLTNFTFLNSVIEASWFNFFAGFDITRWGAWITSLASNGQKLINWDSGVVEFTASYASSASLKKLRFNISPNCTFKVTGAYTVALPRIVSKSHCIDNTSTGLFTFGNSVLISQFGAVVGDESTFAPAMRYALKCGASVDLDGEEYDCDGDLNGVALAFGDVAIKNGKIILPADFSPSALFTLNGNVDFLNLFIDASALSVAKNILYTLGTWKAISMIGGGISTTAGSSAVYDLGIASNYLMTGGTYYSGLFRFASQLNSLTVGNNVFYDSQLNITGFDNTTITSNTFTRSTDTHAILLTGTTKTARNGVIIKNNIYKGQSKNYFVGATFPTAIDDNYPMCIEDNAGTDVSTSYTFVRVQEIETDTAKFFALGDNNPATSLPYVNYTACINGGFFVMTEFAWGAESRGSLYDPKGASYIAIDEITTTSQVSTANIMISLSGNHATPQKIYITLKRGFTTDVYQA